MTKHVFVAGPLRTPDDIGYLEAIERALRTDHVSIFLPHKAIGVLARDALDLAPLQANLDALKTCDLAVFVLDRERTGTGLELGYLHCLWELGLSSAIAFGLVRPGREREIDLMARFCLTKTGGLVTSLERLAELSGPILRQ